ncbi:uncharacterized protein tmem119a [Aplochiton taeniatus]
MRPSLTLRLMCVTLVLLWSSGCHATPLLFNVSMDGSGDGGELELLFPTAYSTHAPVQNTPTPGGPSLTNTITTTMIRLKDFVLSRIVDFLQENLLIIIVVTSLLIVLVFIICCASAMSHKRKLEAYKPPAKPSKKNAEQQSKPGVKFASDFQERPYAVDHVKRVQTVSMASPKNLRAPSKALVGEKGRAVKSPQQEVKKVREVEVEKKRDEPKHKPQLKQSEEIHQSSSSSQPVVCTCHLRK